MFDNWQPLAVDAHAIAAVEALPYKENKSGNLVSGLFAIRSDGTATFADASNMLGAGRYTKIQEAATGGGWIWAINEPSGNHLGGTIRRRTVGVQRRAEGAPHCRNAFAVAREKRCSAARRKA